MRDALLNDIWRYRKRHGLTQDDLAFLLGTRDGTGVSRYERGTREPSLRKVLACQLLFGVPPRQLFSGIYEEVEQDVIKRARRLSEERQRSKRHRPSRYRDGLLAALAARGEGRAPSPRVDKT